MTEPLPELEPEVEQTMELEDIRFSLLEDTVMIEDKEDDLQVLTLTRDEAIRFAQWILATVPGEDPTPWYPQDKAIRTALT